MRLPLLTILTILFLPGRAQLAETFADSNFTAAPAWSGTPGAWTVNSAGQLQSTHPLANSSFYLSTPLMLSGDLQWEFWLRLAFATSSANYADLWLLSANADPATPGNTGYFVRIGGTQDEVTLYRKDAGGAVKIIDGADGVTSGSDNTLRLRISRSAGSFHLQRAGASGSFTTEGATIDHTYGSGAFVAIQVRQSTSSFFGKHFVDDLFVRPFIPDTDAPRILSVIPRSDSTADLRFNEAVRASDASVAANYQLAGGAAAVSAVPDAADAALVYLRFATTFQQGRTLLLTVRQIHDEWGNLLLQDTGSFLWYSPRRGDVLIQEFMADPDPPAGLPAVEWVELRNVSPHPVNISGWRFRAGSSWSGPMPDMTLAADSFLLIASVTGGARMSAYGAVAALSPFPGLDNEGDTLVLYDAGGRVLHALAWDRSWYRNTVKESGGWSLELADASNPCGGAENWAASGAAAGGTPGKANSSAAFNPDRTGPVLLRTWTTDSLQMVAVFSEPLDSTQASVATFTLVGGISIIEATPVSPLFVEIRLRLSRPLEAGKVYELVVEGLADCAGNPIGPYNRAPAGLPRPPAPGQLLVNEILFQPNTGSAEWVELYNNGSAPIDLSQCLVAGRSTAGSIVNAKRIAQSPWLLFPGAYAVCTGDAVAVQSQYAVVHPNAILESGIPSLPDDGGNVVLLEATGNVLDEVRYDPDWHHPLLHDPRGVSLERLSAGGPSQDRHNWHSAAQSAGYATPTARNSQHRDAGSGEGVNISPRVFSPDGDGIDDIAFVAYEMEESGFNATVRIFDAAGRPVRYLVRNALMGRHGRWTWDGTDDKGVAAPPGAYVALIELIHPEGKRQAVKRTLGLVRRG